MKLRMIHFLDLKNTCEDFDPSHIPVTQLIFCHLSECANLSIWDENTGKIWSIRSLSEMGLWGCHWFCYKLVSWLFTTRSPRLLASWNVVLCGTVLALAEAPHPALDEGHWLYSLVRIPDIEIRQHEWSWDGIWTQVLRFTVLGLDHLEADLWWVTELNC